MLLITKRRQIGAICGHIVYAVSKTEMIPLPNSSVRSNIINSRNENRYKKLLCTVDLTKDFFFSYSYHIMRSLQRNMCDTDTGHVLYETMFVWNEFLTRGIRNQLQNTIWTVAQVYGFFKQDTLEISGREFILTLIARRSRHYAGTRYLRRGVNEKGRVANDVETEQIVFPEGLPIQISSIIQNRGSIPLFWSQETSRLNIKPDIILSKKDQNYQATRLHIENLVKRYGNPIIILNLIKTHEKKPREAILRQEFANAIEFINKDLSEENRLRFLHWDLHKHFRSKATNVLLLLCKMATYALALTGFFYCQASSTLRPEDCLKWPPTEYSLRGGANGEQQHSLMSFLELFNVITAMLGWMLRNKMQLTYSWGIFSHNRVMPALWKLGSDQHYDTGRLGDDDARSFIKRSSSDGNILRDSSTPMSAPNAKNEKFSNPGLPDRSGEGSKAFCESSPEISTTEAESDISFSRYTPSMPRKQLFVDMQRERCAESHHIYYAEHGDSFSCSNFVDLDWLSSSANSCEEEPYERSSITNSPIGGLSSENIVNGVIVGEATASTSDLGSSSLKLPPLTAY